MQKATDVVNYWLNASRGCSANYIIGSAGDIVGVVPEEFRAWCTGGYNADGSVKRLNGVSGSDIDYRGIAIEVCDTDLASLKVADAAYNALLDLVTDICVRNGIAECTFTGDEKGTLQAHRWYAQKSCPGDYLFGKFPAIAEEVTRRLNESEDEEMTLSKFKELYKEMIADAHGAEHSDWSDATVKKAIEKGIFQGDGNGNYEWEEPITRQELATVLERLGVLK
jgi:hypothetical protein